MSWKDSISYKSMLIIPIGSLKKKWKTRTYHCFCRIWVFCTPIWRDNGVKFVNFLWYKEWTKESYNKEKDKLSEREGSDLFPAIRIYDWLIYGEGFKGLIHDGKRVIVFNLIIKWKRQWEKSHDDSLKPEDVNKFDTKILFKDKECGDNINERDQWRTCDESDKLTNESVGDSAFSY